MTSGRRVLVTTRLFDEQTRTFLREHDCEVVDAGLPVDATDAHLGSVELGGILPQVDAWIIGVAPLNRELLAIAPRLRIVARRGVGYDRIDLEAARECGVAITTAPGGNEPAVADHTIALMLAVGSRFGRSHARLLEGDWRVQAGMELYQKTVSLIGFGRIGRQVAQRLHGFGVEVLVFDPAVDPATAEAFGVALVPLEQALRRGDIVSLHLPLARHTHHVIDATALRLMKPSAILVNTARGGLVDEAALHAALSEDRLWGAGLDVFEHEGATPLDALTLSLVSHPHVVATPHIAGSSREGLRRTNLIAARCVLSVLDGQAPAPECVVVEGRARGAVPAHASSAAGTAAS